MADKSPQAFRTIREVADWLGVEAHALRFWESKFSQIKPVKRAGGRRYYRPADMQLIGGIKTLLHDQGLTIRGVQKVIREEGVTHVASLSPPLDEELDSPAEDQVVEAVAVESSALETAGFVDIETPPGTDDPVEADSPPAPSEAEPAPEPAAMDAATAAETPDTAGQDDPAHATPAPDAENTLVAAMAAPQDDAPVEAAGDVPPTPLSELRALLHGAVPFSLSQQQQLAPMVARLEALAARLGSHGPSA